MEHGMPGAVDGGVGKLASMLFNEEKILNSDAAQMLMAEADPGDILFNCLPEPRTHPYRSLVAEETFPFDAGRHEAPSTIPEATKQTTFRYFCAIQCFSIALSKPGLVDPVSESLRAAAEAFAKNTNVITFIGELASVALDSTSDINIGEGSTNKKFEHLAYYRWLALGAKDEDDPFEDHPKKKKAPSHKHIPTDILSSVCGNCGKGGANHNCDKCLIRSDGRSAFKQAYCNKACKLAHGAAHKTACEEMQRVSRAASMFKEVFVHYLLKMNYHDLTDITEKDGLVVNTLASLAPKAYTGGIAFHSFPTHLARTREEAVASLLAIQTRECLDNFENMLKTFFRRVGTDLVIFFGGAITTRLPLVKSIERVSVLPKNVERPACNVDGDKSGILKHFISMESHDLIRLTTESGIELAFDPTGAQFGWSEVITPWEAYESHRVQQIISATGPNDIVRPEKHQYMLMRYGSAQGQQVAEVLTTRTIMMIKLTTVLNAEIFKGGGMFNMTNLGHDEFLSTQGRLLEACKDAIDSRALNWYSDPSNRFFMNSFLIPEVCGTTEDADRLKKVWLHQALYEALKDKQTDLHRLWFPLLDKAGLYHNMPGSPAYPFGSAAFL
ncbi:uncharacterized protein E0L32_005396 [Thyridium curvatum]|uniref:Suppressor of anucleate metulae protein B n=1 Tax=Thyridium curvatum TaxID=1093900 RepID=A0A507AWU2_9PEZI|nr:uncharacterized protein E0L32_005396 [Thyridium curvatum]TPX14432.1 hypothetical protein E0L32_005396 [Thyridium curvatum]